MCRISSRTTGPDARTWWASTPTRRWSPNGSNELDLRRAEPPNLDAAALDAHLKRGLGRRRRAVPKRAVAQREARAMARALDLVALDAALAERAAAVRAAVVDCVDVLAITQQEDRGVVDHDAQRSALWQRRSVRRGPPVRV